MTFRFGKHKTAILLISRTLRVVLRLKISIIGLLVVFVRRSLRSGLMLINFNKLLNKWTKTINVSCLSPLIELTNHMRSHNVWLSTAPKLEKCVTCPISISKNQTLSAWHLLCLYHVHVCHEEELQLIFLEDSRTLEYSTCILLQRLCAVQFENILCTCVLVCHV